VLAGNLSVSAIVTAHGQQLTADLPNAPIPEQLHGVGSAGKSLVTSRGAQKMPQSPMFLPPLSPREKYALAYRRIVSVQTPLKAGFTSGFELAAGTGPAYATNGWPAFGKRFGYNTLNIATTAFFKTAFVPTLVHQDPRYVRLGEGTVKVRVLWALRSEFVGFSDDHRPMPNYGNIAGLGLAAIAANAYLPSSSVGVHGTVESYCIKLSAGTGLNVAREFAAFERLKILARHSGIEAW
jgi:hypothetical protein